jgi:hypothetical protein
MNSFVSGAISWKSGIAYNADTQKKRSDCRCTLSPTALATATEDAITATVQARKASLETMIVQE